MPARDTWFRDERWQAGEREVEAHVLAGEVTVSGSAEDLLADLAVLDEEAAVTEARPAVPTRPARPTG